MKEPIVSVVVIGRNEGARLAHCLESIRHVDFDGELEVIYVDSNSQDGSPELAEQLGAKVIRIVPKHACAAIGRNTGWREANAPYILFLDGDTKLHPLFLNKALAEMHANPDVVVVCGNRRESYPEHSLFNRVLDLDWIFPTGFIDFCGGDALMRRSILNETGGYNEDLIAGEEPELCQRIRGLGKHILHIDQPMTSHDLAIYTWQAYWRRALRTGYAYADVSQRLLNSEFQLWKRECRHNFRQTLILFGVSMFSLIEVWRSGKSWPLIGLMIFISLLSLRSAYKARWKSDNVLTLFFYGLHSHLQQLPITIGQISYWWDKYRQRRRLLIEYK